MTCTFQIFPSFPLPHPIGIENSFDKPPQGKGRIRNIFDISTNISHILHPLAPSRDIGNSLVRRILGIVLFIFASLVTCGGMAAFYLYFASKKMKTMEKLSQARIQLQIFSKSAEQLDEKTKKQLGKIEEVVNSIIYAADEVGKLHAFYDNVTDVTLSIRNNEDLKKIWRVFLNSIHQTKMYVPYFKMISLDLTPQINYLNNLDALPEKNVLIEKLDSTSSRIKKDLKEVSGILNESFKQPYFKVFLKGWLFQKNRVAVVARDVLSKQIVGLTIVDTLIRNKQKKIHLLKVARKGNAAKRGIGSAIFEYLGKEYFQFFEATLAVFKENTSAISLYKKFGFEFSAPVDNCKGHLVEMIRNN